MLQVLNCRLHSRLQVLKCMHRQVHKAVLRLVLMQVRLMQVRMISMVIMFRMQILRKLNKLP